MKKLLLATAAIVTLGATGAQAQVNLTIGINEEPVYTRPAIYPSYVSGRERHHSYDWNYWHHQQELREAEERREREAAERARWEREHHHDKGRHLGQLKHAGKHDDHDDHGHH